MKIQAVENGYAFSARAYTIFSFHLPFLKM